MGGRALTRQLTEDYGRGRVSIVKSVGWKIYIPKMNVNASHNARKTRSLVCNMSEYDRVVPEKGRMGTMCELHKEQDSCFHALHP